MQHGVAQGLQQYWLQQDLLDPRPLGGARGDELRQRLGHAREHRLVARLAGGLLLVLGDRLDDATHGQQRVQPRRTRVDAAPETLREAQELLEGTLAGLDPPNAARPLLRIDVDGKPVTVERSRVALVALNTELARLPKPKGPYGRLVLADGSRLSLASRSVMYRLLAAMIAPPIQVQTTGTSANTRYAISATTGRRR